MLLFLIGCQLKESTNPDDLVNRSILAHGFDKLEGKVVSFDFRGRQYKVERFEDRYIYYRIWEDSIGLVTDQLVNSSEFSRTINGQEIVVDEKWQQKYSNSVNSVLYFFQLPYGLNDPAVIKKFEGKTTINEEPYYQVLVTFRQENGGEDFQDEYMYWIHEKNYTVDFLAYNYITDGGGVRFRQAINRRNIEGMLFQDYINYKPDSKVTPLRELPKLLESDQLKQLSLIISENIQVTYL